MDENKPVTEEVVDEKKLKEYLNCLTKYRLRDGTEGNMTLEELGNSLSDRVGKYSSIKNNLIARAKRTEKTEIKKINEAATSDDMIKMAVDYLSSISDRLGSMARKVLSGTEAHIRINIRKDSDPINYSSATTSYDGSRFVTDLQVKKDIGGVIAIAQELVNAAICVEHKTQSTLEDERHDKFAQGTAKTFVGLMLIDYVGEKENLSPDQIDKLQCGVLEDTVNNISLLEDYEKVVREILEHHPDLSKKDVKAMTPDDYKKAWNTIKESTLVDHEKIEDTVEDIAEDGKSAQFLSNEVANDMAEVLAANSVITDDNPEIAMEETTKAIVNGAIAGNTIADSTGISKETAVDTCSTQIDEVLDATPQVPFATVMDNAREREENENVMVMERKPQHPTTSN